jgi:hypothetical protein
VWLKPPDGTVDTELSAHSSHKNIDVIILFVQAFDDKGYPDAWVQRIKSKLSAEDIKKTMLVFCIVRDGTDTHVTGNPEGDTIADFRGHHTVAVDPNSRWINTATNTRTRTQVKRIKLSLANLRTFKLQSKTEPNKPTTMSSSSSSSSSGRSGSSGSHTSLTDQAKLEFEQQSANSRLLDIAVYDPSRLLISTEDTKTGSIVARIEVVKPVSGEDSKWILYNAYRKSKQALVFVGDDSKRLHTLIHSNSVNCEGIAFPVLALYVSNQTPDARWAPDSDITSPFHFMWWNGEFGPTCAYKHADAGTSTNDGTLTSHRDILRIGITRATDKIINILQVQHTRIYETIKNNAIVTHGDPFSVRRQAECNVLSKRSDTLSIIPCVDFLPPGSESMTADDILENGKFVAATATTTNKCVLDFRNTTAAAMSLKPKNSNVISQAINTYMHDVAEVEAFQANRKFLRSDYRVIFFQGSMTEADIQALLFLHTHWLQWRLETQPRIDRDTQAELTTLYKN